jgi:hypothetical protein
VSDNEVNYGLKEPFDIDNGELAGVDAVNAFVMGVEWQMISAQLDSGDPIARPIHDTNRQRIQRMCIRRGRKCQIKPNGEGWYWLEVQ